jgi:hypothetical protein
MREIKFRAWDGLQKRMRPWQSLGIDDPEVVIRKDGKLRRSVLLIKDKVPSGTTLEDAEELAGYAGLKHE